MQDSNKKSRLRKKMKRVSSNKSLEIKNARRNKSLDKGYRIKYGKDNDWSDSDSDLDYNNKNNLSDSNALKLTQIKNEKEIPLQQLKRRIPWMSEKTRVSNGLIKLHNEILDFYEFIKPKEQENIKRDDTINLFKQLIQDKWPSWKVKVFGSYPLELHLPDSDIDLVVFKDNSSNRKYISDTEHLEMIYEELVKRNFVNQIRLVDARVPIIKARCRITGICFDIS